MTKKPRNKLRPRPGLPEPGDDAPYWLPTGSLWHDLPPAIKKAVHQVLLPLWKGLVLDPQDALERSAGTTLVHLMWLELCDQAHIGSVVGIRDSIFSIRADPDSMIARHLNLISAKNQTWALLARQRMARELLATVERSVPGPGPNTLPALPFIPDRQPATTLNVPSRAAQHPMPAAPPQVADWPTIPFTPAENNNDVQAKT